MRNAAKGAPQADLEGQALAGGPAPVNPENGKPTPENGKGYKADPEGRKRLKAGFVSAQFPDGPRVDQFKGVKSPSRQQKEKAEQFAQTKSEREKIAATLTAPKGKEIAVFKNGAIVVRDAKTKVRASGAGIVPKGLGAPVKGKGGKFTRPPSSKVVIEDRDAFNASVRAKAESEGTQFFRGDKPSTRQTDLFQDAIFDALGV